MMPAKKLTDEEILKLREDKVELNRHSRRQTRMKFVCKGKSDGVLECETTEGRCPEYPVCHKDGDKA